MVNIYRKNMFLGSRLVYVTQPVPELPIVAKEKETLDNVTEAVRKSYEQQLLLMKDLKQTLRPISEEIDAYWKVVQEMHETLVATGKSPQERDVNILGEKIHITMDGRGEYQEQLSGKDISFFQWAMQKKKSVQE